MMQKYLRVIYTRKFPQVSDRCDVEFPPLFVTDNCQYPGLMVEIIDLIAGKLNMTILPIIAGDLSDPKDFDIREVYELINNGSVDTLATSFQYTEARSRQFSFTNPIYKVHSGFIMKQLGNVHTSMWAFFSIFDFSTWISILGVLLLQCILYILIDRTESVMNNKRPVNIFESIWQILRLQFMQPDKINFKSKAGKVFFICFSLIQCTILLGVYSNFILSKILTTDLPIPVDSIENLVEKIRSNEYHLTATNDGNWFMESIHQSKHFPFSELRSALEKNPIRFATSSLDILHKIKHDKAVGFTLDDYELNYYFMQNCGFSKLRASMIIQDAHIVFSKNSTLVKYVNRVISENMMEIAEIAKKYLDVLIQLDHPTTCIETHRSLKLDSYYGLLISCGILILVAIVVFFVEFLIGCYYKSRVVYY